MIDEWMVDCLAISIPYAVPAMPTLTQISSVKRVMNLAAKNSLMHLG
jgi:hypothetical protein